MSERIHSSERPAEPKGSGSQVSGSQVSGSQGLGSQGLGSSKGSGGESLAKPSIVPTDIVPTDIVPTEVVAIDGPSGAGKSTIARKLAQSLGYWTRRKMSNEARHIVDEVVLAADRPGFDEYRMRVETALQESVYGEAALGQLRSWTQSGMPFEMRSFALSILLGQKAVGPATRNTLVAIVANDPDRALRDYAARQLGKLPFGSDSRGALQTLFHGSSDWSLRLTALSSLVGILPAAERDALLQQAANDADSRVSRRAERLAKRFR